MSRARLLAVLPSVLGSIAFSAPPPYTPVRWNEDYPYLSNAAERGDWADPIKNIPLGKFGEVDDIASAVAFLASLEAKYITGQCLTVDGGMVMT